MRLVSALNLIIASVALHVWGADINPGDEVVVVYNTRVPESKSIAEHYAQMRKVPLEQIFGYSLPTTDDMTRGEYRDSLQRPLAKALEQKKLWRIASKVVPAVSNMPAHVEWKPVESKIRYAVLCYGVPLRIAEDPNLREVLPENVRPEMRRNVAAVDNELCLLPLSEQKLPLGGFLRNFAFGCTNSDFLHPTNGILLVTRLDGPNPGIARALVDKAMQAERDGLWGRGYFDVRNTPEVGLKIGDEWIRNAAEICHRLGFETTIDENESTFPASFPMSQIAIYLGWYSENACGPFVQKNVEFMPGAFAYHLHSYSAATLRTTNRFWAGPLLAKGATVTMGCVDEPYLGGTPEVAVVTARLIFQGFSFGEAAYAGEPVLSWQTTVVGDPLYRPFGRTAEALHQDLAKRGSKLLEWSYLRLANLNLANKRPTADVVTLLEQLELTKTSAVLKEKLGDLYAVQGKPSSCVHEYQEAIKFSTSPQQKIRLALELGEKLLAQNQEDEAFEVYQTMFSDNPEYPDKASLLKKLLPLAQKLKKTAEAQKYEAEIRALAPLSQR